jgi:pimeloyl-ACP methyl ester carboxylesterase
LKRPASIQELPVKQENLLISGVHIDHVAPEEDSGAAPLVFIHGGSHGSWMWEEYLRFFAATGRDCYAFSWFGHNGSRELTVEELIRRSLFDVTEELDVVESHVGRTPVLVAHSMGAPVAQKYAQDHPVAGLVLMAPAICKEVGTDPVPIEFDLAAPFTPPPFEVSQALFFSGCTEADARRYHSLMSDESPLAISEVARGGSLSLDRTRLGGPCLVVGAEDDLVVPAEAARRTADYFGADYLFLHGRGHSMVVEPRWRETASRIARWLDHALW